MKEDQVPKPGEQYRHYKGRTYTVFCVAVAEKKEETAGDGLLVIYGRPDSACVWSRPLTNWLEQVGGRPRFELIGKNYTAEEAFLWSLCFLRAK